MHSILWEILWERIIVTSKLRFELRRSAVCKLSWTSTESLFFLIYHHKNFRVDVWIVYFQHVESLLKLMHFSLSTEFVMLFWDNSLMLSSTMKIWFLGLWSIFDESSLFALLRRNKIAQIESLTFRLSFQRSTNWITAWKNIFKLFHPHLCGYGPTLDNIMSKRRKHVEL